MRRSRVSLCLSVAIVIGGCVVVGERAPAQVGRSGKLLTGALRTAHFDVHFRPKSRAAASADWVAVNAERAFTKICGQLAFTPDTRFALWIYDDAHELTAITGVTGTAGFSSNAQLHVPYDNVQTLTHELVHVIAFRLPKAGDEPRSLFFAEGLANAVLEYVDEIHVHAVAAFELRVMNRLPALSEMTGAKDFYAWLARHRGIPAYDIAASWMRFLIDRHGVEKTLAYYTGKPAAAAFGVALAELEAAWRTELAEYELRPELVTLLLRRRGKGGTFEAYPPDVDARLPAEVVGEAGDWHDLAGASRHPTNTAHWTRSPAGLSGKAITADWDLCGLGEDDLGDAMLRVRVRPAPGAVGVQVQLGTRCQAMVTNAGTFLYAEEIVAADREETVSGRAQIDLLLVRRGDRATVYVDGRKVLDAQVDAAAGRPAVGVALGEAVFESVTLRRL